MHTPVLLQEAIDFLNLRPGSFVIDGTIGAGGHAQEIIKRISPGGTLLGIDWDEQAIDRLNLKSDSYKVILQQGNYADLAEIMSHEKLPKADALLLDLGFSSDQIGQSGKGFSFQQDEPLLMVYEKDRASVSEILRQTSEKDLADIIFQFSGERMSRRIAKAIKEYLRKERIETTGQLRSVIHGAVGRGYENGRIDPATRTFQALRIFANEELKNLETILQISPDILAPGARIVVISFHSLEDRIVKNQFSQLGREQKISILTKKPVIPTAQEVRTNPRSRSAKLRAAEVISS